MQSGLQWSFTKKVVKLIMHSLFIVFDFRQSVLSFKVERKEMCESVIPRTPFGTRRSNWCINLRIIANTRNFHWQSYIAIPCLPLIQLWLQMKASSMWYMWLYPWCLFILCTMLSCFEELAAYSPGQRQAEIKEYQRHALFLNWDFRCLQ